MPGPAIDPTPSLLHQAEALRDSLICSPAKLNSRSRDSAIPELGMATSCHVSGNGPFFSYQAFCAGQLERERTCDSAVDRRLFFLAFHNVHGFSRQVFPANRSGTPLHIEPRPRLLQQD